MSDVQELIAERLAVMAAPPQPKPKPRYNLYVIESRDWVAVYIHFWTGLLFRKYPVQHFRWNEETVKLKLEAEGHHVITDTEARAFQERLEAAIARHRL